MLESLRQSKKLTLIKCLALLSSPRVVWRELSAPTGTRSFRFSRQLLRWARRFFSSSLWVDLLRKIVMRFKIFIGEKYPTRCVAYKWCWGKESGMHTWLHSWGAYERQVFRLYQQLHRVVGRRWTLEYFMGLYVCFDLNLVPLLPDFRADSPGSLRSCHNVISNSDTNNKI